MEAELKLRPEDSPVRSNARITFVLCALAALFEGFDNQSMGEAAPKLALEFGLSAGQKGLIFSAATLGLLVGAAPGGRAADFLGRKRTLSVSLLLFGACSFLRAIATGPHSLFVARLLTGLGLAQASWTAVCFNLSGALGAVLLGRPHAGKRGRLWAVLTYAGMAVALGAVPAAGNVFYLAAFARGLAGVFIVGVQLILFALALLYYGRPIRCTGVGASVEIGRLGSVVGPLFASAPLAGGAGSASVLIGILPFVLLGGSAALALTWREQCGK
jgi:MFS family permease